MITRIDDYFASGCGRCPRFGTPGCSARLWARGLGDLRRICRDAGLTETVKWGHPCYMHAGRNIAIIGARRGGYSLGFFNPALMKDPENLLRRQGPNTRHAGTLGLTDNGQAHLLAPVIRSYLIEAMGYAAAGITAPKEQAGIDLPEELICALDADPDLAWAFHALTPGRQRSYVINLSGAKTSATRTARIAKFRDRILAGKGATER